jgi:hypothetical protein
MYVCFIVIDLHERWRCRCGEELIRKFAFILTDLQIKQSQLKCLYSHVQQAEA